MSKDVQQRLIIEPRSPEKDERSLVTVEGKTFTVVAGDADAIPDKHKGPRVNNVAANLFTIVGIAAFAPVFAHAILIVGEFSWNLIG